MERDLEEPEELPRSGTRDKALSKLVNGVRRIQPVCFPGTIHRVECDDPVEEAGFVPFLNHRMSALESEPFEVRRCDEKGSSFCRAFGFLPKSTNKGTESSCRFSPHTRTPAGSGSSLGATGWMAGRI